MFSRIRLMATFINTNNNNTISVTIIQTHMGPVPMQLIMGFEGLRFLMRLNLMPHDTTDCHLRIRQVYSTRRLDSTTNFIFQINSTEFQKNYILINKQFMDHLDFSITHSKSKFAESPKWGNRKKLEQWTIFISIDEIIVNGTIKSLLEPRERFDNCKFLWISKQRFVDPAQIFIDLVFQSKIRRPKK